MVSCVYVKRNIRITDQKGFQPNSNPIWNIKIPTPTQYKTRRDKRDDIFIGNTFHRQIKERDSENAYHPPTQNESTISKTFSLPHFLNCSHLPTRCS